MTSPTFTVTSNVLPASRHCCNLQYKKHKHMHAAHDMARVDRTALIQKSLTTPCPYMSPCTFMARCGTVRGLLRPTIVATVAVAVAIVCAVAVDNGVPIGSIVCAAFGYDVAAWFRDDSQGHMESIQ